MIWGLSGFSHDAALAVVNKYGVIEFASHSERYTGNKHDLNFGDGIFDAALTYGQPETVVWYEHDLLKRFRQFRAGQYSELLDPTPLSQLKQTQGHIFKDYPGSPAPEWRQHRHHLTHAAAGFATSPYNEAAVLVIDAIGEFNTASIWKATADVHGNCTYKLLEKVNYPHSLGLVYSAFTKRVGLKPLDEEYILMGMAAYGNPDRLYKDIIKDFIYFPDPLDDGNLIYFKENLHKGCKYWRPDLTSEQDLFDIAAATQAVYETILIKTLEYAKRLVPSDNLVFMGGCALNCKANPLAYRYFKNLWIMPAPGDSGSAIGAVLAQTKEHVQWPGPFLGYDMSYHSNDEKIVDYLIKHKICGLARGPAEFGPRALGNRSLLADPRTDNIKDRVNEIKQRQKFRPFAPAILAELADDYFDIPSGSSPYMQMVARCRNPELFPAVVHADGTSRVQTVAADGSPFRRLLELWYKQTGCPMLLNTSLNVRGKPMVNDHKDALAWEREYKIPIFN